jgi:hypothetical protein
LDNFTVGTILNGSGSQSAPSYSFAAGTSTGFYYSAANSIGVALGGSPIGVFNSTLSTWTNPWSVSANFTIAPVFPNSAHLILASSGSGITERKPNLYVRGGAIYLGVSDNVNFSYSSSGWVTCPAMVQNVNVKHYFGTGVTQQGSIYSDGTNTIINPKEVGTGYLSILGDVVSSGDIKAATYHVGATAGVDIASGTIKGMVVTKGIVTAGTSVTPVADGTYTVGAKLTPVTGIDGTITVSGGIITAIQPAT